MSHIHTILYLLWGACDWRVEDEFQIEMLDDALVHLEDDDLLFG
jgi:hypothetical protein